MAVTREPEHLNVGSSLDPDLDLKCSMSKMEERYERGGEE
jgi:hypothetical protein